jgi:peptide methionine sulfoxide reductase msrA/msrB
VGSASKLDCHSYTYLLNGRAIIEFRCKITDENAFRNSSATGEQCLALFAKILPASTFYQAEEYHQNYHKKNPLCYKLYRIGSGCDAFIKKHWFDKKQDEELRKKLTPLQYEVTKRNGATV